MIDSADITSDSLRVLSTVIDSTETLESSFPAAAVEASIERRLFRPAEEAALMEWFARMLTIRDAVWETLDDVISLFHGEVRRVEEQQAWEPFLCAYASACLVVRIDRFLIEQAATHTLVQRKLNEGSLERRIPRKQFTAIFESLARPSTALLLRDAMKLAQRSRDELLALRPDPRFGWLIERLPWLEQALNPSKRDYIKLLFGYGEHAVRRHFASGKQQATMTVLESSGRVISELRDHWSENRITPELHEQIASILRPGDVIATRHDAAMTNLFLPGYWPHVALHVGAPPQEGLDDELRERWSDDRVFLEAHKDGVRFRRLEKTLGVDAIAVIRPRLEPNEIRRAIAQAATHEGKLYNFDFDFFRSDRLVCTEVVYRAFDGIGAMKFELTERAGRPTLSAEDLLDLAFDSDQFEVVAFCDSDRSQPGLIVGESAREQLARSYRETD